MRASVAAAWPAHISSYEGRCEYLYLDTKRLATTGVGYLCDSIPASQALPWLTTANSPATPAEIEADWRKVKARTDLAPKGGYAYKGVGLLHLAEPDIDALLMKTTARFWDRLLETLPELESYPADTQLAILDLSYQNGPAFLDTKSGGQYVWAGTRAAVLAQDWAKAATHVPGTATSRRAITRRRLFNNAAKVKALSLDPEPLWNETEPTAPVVAPPVIVTPPTPEPEDPPMVARVAFRGGITCSCVAASLPIVERVMLERGLIQRNIDIYQLGYRNDVGASAGTHAGGGNTDVGQFTDKHIAVWREMGWTMQRRTRAQGFDSDHGHGWPFGCPHLSPGGKAQNNQWKRRTNGLASYGPIAGKWPVPGWKTPYNTHKKRFAAIDAKARAEAERLKELELPTPKELLDADEIDAPNDAPDKKTNPKWRWRSYIWHTYDKLVQVLASNKRIEAKLDAILKNQEPKA